MSTPFISICIPTYNRADLLERLLRSVRVQTFKNFEILVNDNSSNDNVENLIRDHFADLAIDYVRNQPAVSAAGNCIKVIERAKGQWIKVMHDDDDFDSPDALQLFAHAAEQSGKDFIFCATNQVWLGTGRKEDDYLQPSEKEMLDESFYSLFYLNTIGHPSTMMTRADHSIQYDANFNWVLDIDYYMRYFMQHPGYYYIPEKLVNIGRSASQATHLYSQKMNAEIPEYFRLLAKYGGDLHLQDRYVFHRVWDLLRVFRVKNIEQLYGTGYEGALPARIEEIIRFQKKIPRLIIKQPPWSKAIMKRYFKKISAKHAKNKFRS